MSNQIATGFTPLVYVDPFPGLADDAAVSLTCQRCFGEGIISGFEHVDGGRCFECYGHGSHASTAGEERVKEQKRVKRDNADQRKTERRQKFHNEQMAAAEAQYPELSIWWELISEDNFLMDLWSKAFDHELTEKQVAAAAASVNRRAEWAAKKAEEAKAKAALPPAPSGKVEVSGTIKSVTYKENDFGGAWKMIVEGPEGWRVWSTVPAKVIDAAMEEQAARDSSDDEEYVGWSDFLVGRTITFTATLEPSQDDKSFAFAKRPTKAAVK
jgi:hypothetical protein